MAEMTSTPRAGFFRFSFVSKDQAYVLVSPNSDEGQGYIKVDPEKQEIYGYNPVHRIYQGWGQPAGFNGYFVVRFNKPIDNFGCYFQMEDHKGEKEIGGKADIGAYAKFENYFLFSTATLHTKAVLFCLLPLFSAGFRPAKHHQTKVSFVQFHIHKIVCK